VRSDPFAFNSRFALVFRLAANPARAFASALRLTGTLPTR
jgi:hypothetical protein